MSNSILLPKLILIIAILLIIGLVICIYFLFRPKRWRQIIKRKLIRIAIKNIRKYNMATVIKRYLEIYSQ